MRTLVFALVAISSASSVRAQQESMVVRGDSYMGGSAGYSWHSPAGTHWGLITGRRIYLASGRLERITAVAGPMAFAESIDFPLAIVERTKPESTECWPHQDPGFINCRVDYSSRVALGAGAMPGLKLLLNRNSETRFFAAGAAGMMAFNSEVPVERAGRVNFALEYGAGVEISTSRSRVMTIGYKFYHVSNGSTRDYNPGLDGNVLYIGLLKRR